MDERRCCGATAIRADTLGTEQQAKILASDDVEGPARSNLDERSEREIAEEALGKRIAALVRGSLEDAAGDPAMALVVDGVGALQVTKAAVLRLEGGLEVGAVIDGVRPGVAGEQSKVAREALFQ